MAKRRKFVPWKVAIGVIVVLVGGAWGTLKVAEVQAENAVQTELTKLRKLGYPVTPADMHARTPKDEAQNAAPLYRQAIAKLKEVGSPKYEYTSSSGVVDVAARDAFVRTTDPVYQIIVQAVQLEHCNFERKWEMGWHLLFPEYADMKMFARISSSRADMLSAAGDWRSALDSLAVGIKIAPHTTEPLLIAHLVAIACESIVMKSFHELMGQHAANPAFLSAAREWLAQTPPPTNGSRAFDFEIIGFRTMLPQLTDPKADFGLFDGEIDSPLMHLVMKTDLGRKRVEANMLAHYSEALSTPYEDPWKDAVRWQKMDQKLEADQSLVGRVTSMLAPMFMGTGEAFARTATTRRQTDVALWVLEQRAQLGTLPFQLPDQARFHDPWTAKRFVYLKEAKGFTLRSVGMNKTDDGGQVKTGPRTDDLDLTITLMR